MHVQRVKCRRQLGNLISVRQLASVVLMVIKQVNHTCVLKTYLCYCRDALYAAIYYIDLLSFRYFCTVNASLDSLRVCSVMTFCIYCQLIRIICVVLITDFTPIHKVQNVKSRYLSVAC